MLGDGGRREHGKSMDQAGKRMAEGEQKLLEVRAEPGGTRARGQFLHRALGTGMGQREQNPMGHVWIRGFVKKTPG